MRELSFILRLIHATVAFDRNFLTFLHYITSIVSLFCVPSNINITVHHIRAWKRDIAIARLRSRRTGWLKMLIGRIKNIT